jgi:hypothetical protein
VKVILNLQVRIMCIAKDSMQSNMFGGWCQGVNADA